MSTNTDATAIPANVLLGADIASARVAHSYFVTADDGGNIANSVPQIVKQY